LSEALGKGKKPELSRPERGNLGRRAVEDSEDLDGLMDEVSDSSQRGVDDEGEDAGLLEMLPQEEELQGEDVLDSEFSGEEAESEVSFEAFEEEPKVRPSRPSSGAARPAPSQAPEPEDELERILNELNKPDDISGSMVVGSEGFVIASVFKEKTELERMAAVLASIIETACRATQRMKLGVFQGVLVETEMGIIDLVNGQGMSLVVFMKEDARLGLVRMRMQKALKSLNEYLA
jgi:predicted regulator of Ras-like GTPase activity (Roadblock/LC7/MglB family)